MLCRRTRGPGKLVSFFIALDGGIPARAPVSVHDVTKIRGWWEGKREIDEGELVKGLRSKRKKPESR